MVVSARLADLRTGEGEEKVQCTGKTKRGKLCKRKRISIAGSIFYCALHADQKPESARESGDDKDFEDEDEDMDIPSNEYCADWTSIRNSSMLGRDDSMSGLGSNADGVNAQCAGMTKKSKRCKTIGNALISMSTIYCEAHVDQKPADALNSNDEDATLKMTDEVLPSPYEIQDEDEIGEVVVQPVVEEAQLIAIDFESAPAAISEFDSHSDLNAVTDAADILGPVSDDQSGAENERVAIGMGLDEDNVLSVEFDSSEDEYNAQMQSHMCAFFSRDCTRAKWWLYRHWTTSRDEYASFGSIQALKQPLSPGSEIAVHRNARVSLPLVV